MSAAVAHLALASVATLVGAGWAPTIPTLRPTVLTALKQVAGQPFRVDCSYADRTNIAIAYPRYGRLPPVVYAKPWLCARANRADAFALLVLTHEAVHVGGVRDEVETECRAATFATAVAATVRPQAWERLRDRMLTAHDAKMVELGATCPGGVL